MKPWSVALALAADEAAADLKYYTLAFLMWVPQSNGALLNPQSGKCLDDTGYGGAGTQVQIWSCTGNANQKWTLP